MSEKLHHELAAHFTDAEIFELGITMAVLRGFAKFVFCFDLADCKNTGAIHRPAQEMTSRL
ncbi:MAG: hypothetical protein AB7G75_26505 [Candidatus Binatia bacterium]